MEKVKIPKSGENFLKSVFEYCRSQKLNQKESLRIVSLAYETVRSAVAQAIYDRYAKKNG